MGAQTNVVSRLLSKPAKQINSIKLNKSPKKSIKSIKPIKLMFVFLALCITFTIVITGCSSSNKSAASGSEAGAYMNSRADVAVSPADYDSLAVSNQSGKGTSAPPMLSAPMSPPPMVTDRYGDGQIGGENYAAMNRKLIYNANLTMQVKDYAASQSEIRDLVALSGGYILQFNDNHTQYEIGGNYTIKVPSNGFYSFLDALAQLKPVKKQQSINGQDVTEEYVDLQARLQAKQVVETRLLTFMEQATRAEDLLKFSEQLAVVQEEIERIKGRIRYLDENVAFSTVELRIYERLDKLSTESSDDELPIFKQASDAMKASFDFITSFFKGLIVLIAGALPILVLLMLIALPILYRWRRNKRFNRSTPAQLAQTQTQPQTQTTPTQKEITNHPTQPTEKSDESLTEGDREQ